MLQYHVVALVYVLLFFCIHTDALECPRLIRRVSHNGVFELCLLWSTDRVALRESSLIIVSHLSVDRLERLELQVGNWDGLVVASILLPSIDSFEESLKRKELKNLLIYKHGALFVTLVRRLDPATGALYPVNMMRNVAMWSAARLGADRALLLDVDAIPVTNQKRMQQDIEKAKESLNLTDGDSKQLFVVPAFEASSATFPLASATKPDLIHALQMGSAKVMHDPRPSYRFDLDRWTKSGESFRMQYRLMYEPYVVYQLPSVVDFFPFDERFTGRGFNKQSHHFQLWASDHQYVILANSFVINLPNPDETKNDDWVKRVRPLWISFRNWISVRYGLDCRESMWKVCDEKGLHCDKVCSKAELSALQRFEKDISRTTETPLKSPEDHHNPSWIAFERISNRRSEVTNRIFPTSRMAIDRNACIQAIDVVYTWVNGSEERHIRERRQFIPDLAFESAVDVGRHKKKMKDHRLEFRFRDFGARASTLRYSIQSLVKHAPWIRKIFIVVADGQTLPSFLNASSERIVLITHSQIMRQECLPTFNSCAIESKLHLIPGLSECFLYLNDDVMLLKKLKPEDYWPASEPVPYAIFDGNEAPEWSKDEWQKKLSNVAKLLRRELDVSKVFLVGHHGHFMVKSVVKDHVYGSLGIAQELNRTECERWRSPNSMWLPMIYSNTYLMKKAPKVFKEMVTYHALTSEGGLAALRKVLHRVRNHPETSGRWLCLNDLLSAQLPEGFEAGLADELSQLFEVSDQDLTSSGLFNQDYISNQ